MGGLSSEYENLALDALLGDDAAPNMPATVYLALFSVVCDDDTFGTELSGGAYARVAITNNSTNFPAASAGSKSNGVAIEFPEATADWDEALGWALLDDPTGTAATNIIFHNEFDSGKVILNGNTATFPIDTLVFGAD